MSSWVNWLMPESASTLAADVDALTHFLVVVSVVFFVFIVAAMIFFAIRYRRRGLGENTSSVDRNHTLEIAWTVVPSILLFIAFIWGFQVYMKMAIVPKDAIEVKVTGQRWFWTFDYANGKNSVGEFVVPVNTPVKLLLSSQDVIHSFFVPVFRIKMDALPNRYTVEWFEATKEGEFKAYCAEFCGTSHSNMMATIKVVSRDAYEAWLEEEAHEGAGLPLAELGKKIYRSNACFTCHTIDGTKGIGPSWKAAFGKTRKLQSGKSILVDENYVRESILDPMAKVSAGYAPVMPTYQGILKDRDIDAIVAYLKELNK